MLRDDEFGGFRQKLYGRHLQSDAKDGTDPEIAEKPKPLSTSGNGCKGTGSEVASHCYEEMGMVCCVLDHACSEL